jgi:hypothetical protein
MARQNAVASRGRMAEDGIPIEDIGTIVELRSKEKEIRNPKT